MAKFDEINYFKCLDKEAKNYIKNKPFSDINIDKLLLQIGTVLSLIPQKPSKILDIGCGIGWTSLFLAKSGHEVLGIDISKYLIYEANKIKKQQKIKNLYYKTIDAEKLNIKNKFDCVLFFNSLHHFEITKTVLKKTFIALKPGGICIIDEPGIFHHKSENAKNEIKNFNTTENDIIPKKIKKLSKRIGFKNFKCYPKISHLNFLIYENFLKSEKLKKISFLLKFLPIRYSILFFILVFFKSYSGLIILKK